MVQIDSGLLGVGPQPWAQRSPQLRATMLRANLLIGKPVVANPTGRQIEVVKDLVFDHENNRLLGFLTNRGGWSGSARVLPWSAVLTVGLRAVIARSGNSVVEAGTIPRVKDVLERSDGVLGKPVETADGDVVGTLVDIFLDKSTGVIKGYEIIDGAVSDKSSSRLFLPAPLALVIDENTVHVSREVSELIEQSRIRPYSQSEAH